MFALKTNQRKIIHNSKHGKATILAPDKFSSTEMYSYQTLLKNLISRGMKVMRV